MQPLQSLSKVKVKDLRIFVLFVLLPGPLVYCVNLGTYELGIGLNPTKLSPGNLSINP